MIFSDYTMVNNIPHHGEMRSFVDYINKNNVEGAVVECGVWRGGIMMMCIDSQKKYNQDREFYLYDTFDGMTEPKSDKDLDGDKRKYNQLKAKNSKWHKVDIEQVKTNVALCNYDKSKIHFVKGDVLETLDKIVPEKIAILRLDTDWYESTKKELEVLYSKVSNNGFVIIDDYRQTGKNKTPRGSRVACDEFFPTIEHEMKLIPPLTDYCYPFIFQKIINK